MLITNCVKIKKMDNKEKTINSEVIYDGKVIRVRKDKVLCPNGLESYREIVDHHGGVGILAFLDSKVALVKQYRYAYDEVLYEMPAGKLEKGEQPYDAGMRELEEEIGYKAESLTYLGKMYPSCGYTNEIINLYKADKLVKSHRHLDDDEFLDVYWFSLKEIKKMVTEGVIKDAKTICALYLLDNK